MLSIKINILYIVLFTDIVGIQSLQKLSTEEDNSIKSAETIIRNTVNKLFTAFKIQESYSQHWLKQLFVIYDFFVSITLKDGDSLKEIVRLSRVYDIDNTRHLIAQVNEVLNESDKSSEINGSDTFVAKHIERFIGKLKYLKDQYDTNKKKYIEDKILSYLNVNRVIYNNSMEIKAGTADEIVDESISNFTEYWRPSARRIYRGFRTRITSFPFMASVQFFKKFQCAGSIIKNDLVITSASCLQLSWNNRFFRENPAFLSVQIGSDFYEHGGENIAVQEIYFHPAYDPKTLRHNLALMRLSRRIAFKKKHKRVRKVQIDRKPHPLSGYDHITVVGWGARDSSNIIYNVQQNRLAYANLDFYPIDECREHYTRQFVSKQNFCAGFFSKGGGACNRDVGGPAIIGHKLMGVISFGTPICGSPDSPTVFTKLGYYADWIDKIMEQDVPSVYKRTTRQLPEIIFPLEENIRTKEIRFTPVISTSTPVPIFIDDIRMGQKESPNDFLPTQKIAALSENNNFELSENKHKNLATYKHKEVIIKNDQISHKIDTTADAKNKLRQQQSNKDESIYDSVGMSIELLGNITTQATIKITKRLYDEESNDISTETESESVNDPPSSGKDDSSYDSTETDPQSIKQSPSETRITLQPQKVNDDENLNKVSTITIQSTNTQPKNQFTLLQFYGVSSANTNNKIKHQKLRNDKKPNIRNFKTSVKQKMKTTTSVTTIMSSEFPKSYSNKFTVQSKHSLNRQFDDHRGNDKSMKTDTESINSNFTEVNNKLMEQQSIISDDLIKRYIKQILNEMNNKKKKSTPRVIVKSKMTSIATNIVLPSTLMKATKNKLKQQFNEHRNNDESLEVTTEYVHHTTLKNITQQRFDVSISDDVIKEYIMQYLIEKKSTTKHQVKSKNQKPLIEDNKEIIKAETESVNDKLTHQELNVGGRRSIINIDKRPAIRTSQNKEKGTIKKVLKAALPTTTAFVTLNKSTGHTKNIFKQLQFDTENESLIDKRSGRHSQLIETIESVTVMPNLQKDVNVRDIKDDNITLFDNLDIEQLLDEVDYGKTETMRTGESNDTKKDIINLKQWTSLKYSLSSDEDGTRVSVPVVSFNNLSITDLPESIEYNKISKSILFDLVSLAVEEEIRRKSGAS